MHKKVSITWLSKPEDHDYAAALSYLNLLFNERTSAMYVGRLKRSPVRAVKSKDIFRASGLPLLGVSNSHVIKDKQKILSNKKLSPVLLVRSPEGAKVIIADGYHRVCAVYYYDEDAVIPCQIV